ncbi:MAG TPA: YwiC-like family protein [Holophagaceae bacterium]|nr:YwiC-like family protein [Holophagaceae bacterium]
MAVPFRPPIPREHGAWIMLGASLVLGLLGGGWPGWGLALCLALATFAGFSLQEVLRHPQKAGLAWLLGLGFLFLATTLILLLRDRSLLLLAPFALVPLGLTEILGRGRRTRPERSFLGELLALPGLTLPCLAAWQLGAGALAPRAWLAWSALLLAFASGVLHVNLLLEGAKAKVRCPWACVDKPLARADLLFHGALLALGTAVTFATGSPFWILASLPLSLRSLYGLRAAGHRRISFRTVGLVESALALWFVGIYGFLR